MSRRGSSGSRFDQGASNGPRPPRYDDQGPSGYRAERYEDQGSSGSFRGASRGGGPGRQHHASKPYGRPGRNDVRARSTSPAPRPNASLGSSAFSRRDGAFAGSHPVLEADIIADRKTREKPVRTLFVRNFKYETPEHLVRAPFDRLGEVSNFFSRLSTRGMCFITFYDLRAAIMAKDTLDGTEVWGRRIDVHYSLPKAEDMAGRCDGDKNQGTIFVTVHGASQLSDFKLSQVFGECGDIKDILPHGESPNQRFIEFFDSRACAAAFAKLNGHSHLGGVIELKWSWDPAQPDAARPVTDADRNYSRASRNIPGGAGGGGARGGYAGAGPPRDPVPSGSGYNSSVANAYASRQPVPSPAPSAGVSGGSMSARLTEAQKVQNLLASLAAGAPAASATLPPPPMPSAPTPVNPYAGSPYPALSAPSPYGGLPAPTSLYGNSDGPVAPTYEAYVPNAASSAPPASGVPANVLAMLSGVPVPPAPATPSYDAADQIQRIIAQAKASASAMPSPAPVTPAPAPPASSANIQALLAALGQQQQSTSAAPTPANSAGYSLRR